jgi:hypothetical protein
VIGAAAAAGAASATAIDRIAPGLYGLIAGAVTGLVVASGALLMLDQLFGLDLMADAAKAFPKAAARLPLIFGRGRQKTGS